MRKKGEGEGEVESTAKNGLQSRKSETEKNFRTSETCTRRQNREGQTRHGTRVKRLRRIVQFREANNNRDISFYYSCTEESIFVLDEKRR